MGERPEAEPANTKLPHVCAVSPAQSAAILLPYGIFLFPSKFDDIRCFRHSYFSNGIPSDANSFFASASFVAVVTNVTSNPRVLSTKV